MRLRKQELGDRNLVGSRVEAVRKQKGMKQKELLAQLQVNGVDMNASGLSKLEGQIRFVTDVELVALADILEGVENILAQLAVEQRRLGRGIIFEFARLRTELRDLALIDDDHALTVSDGDHRAVGNDVV